MSEAAGADFAALIADLERALGELAAHTAGDPAQWTAGRPGKWTAGQHSEHVVLVLEHTAGGFAAAERALRETALGPPPRRGLLERLWVSILLRGWMPRGGRTVPAACPEDHPDRSAVFERGARALERHRKIGARLTPAERDRLWIPNLFMPRWRYTLPELVRVHAVHVRHHAQQVAEIVAAGGRPVQ